MRHQDDLRCFASDVLHCCKGLQVSQIIALKPLVGLLMTAVLTGCSTSPLLPYTTDTPVLVLTTASQAGVADKRSRFREIFCAVLEARKESIPDYRPCETALTHVGQEPPVKDAPVDLGASRQRLIALLVPGIGWDCFSEWLELKGTTATHVQRFGYDLKLLDIDSLSSSENNARQIRDAILALPKEGEIPRLVLIGYSKGAPDILETVVKYPEIHERIAAVVSVSGAVGGSPLANNADQSQLSLLRHWPGAECSPGDGGAVESLRPDTRKAWIAQNPLPDDISYYSLVTYPEPDRISAILKPSYKKLSQVDARNDSQVVFYDQVIPKSSLVAYLNADHWALAVPISRSHRLLKSTFVNHNDYPREALLEALLRFIEEDLAASER